MLTYNYMSIYIGVDVYIYTSDIRFIHTIIGVIISMNTYIYMSNYIYLCYK